MRSYTYKGYKAHASQPRAVRAAAISLASKMVKDALTKNGIKISDVSATDIRKLAYCLLEEQPDLYKLAAKGR